MAASDSDSAPDRNEEQERILIADMTLTPHVRLDPITRTVTIRAAIPTGFHHIVLAIDIEQPHREPSRPASRDRSRSRDTR